MIEFFFFFLAWGSKLKEEIIQGIRLNVGKKEDGYLFNIHYILKQYNIFWIPLGEWEMKEISIQSIKSGKVYSLNPEQEKQAEDLYWKLKKEEIEALMR